MHQKTLIKTIYLMSRPSLSWAVSTAATLCNLTRPVYRYHRIASITKHEWFNATRPSYLIGSIHTSYCATRHHSISSNDSDSPVDAGLNVSADRMIIGFTCKVCKHRSYKSMSKKAYTTGVVMIKCDGCKNTHLIADHLGWFDSTKPPGTIEDIMREKGETVKRVQYPMQYHISRSNATNKDDSTEHDTDVDMSMTGMSEWHPDATADAIENVIADAETDMITLQEQNNESIKNQTRIK
ncbi:hypothetical protein BATDEDRAFT_22160 [Batrachochytrium dendrobatidis JAM81]|uniref:DNL-type domain-containing protein n=3 Tax=Batrachochytrium dendrobatidis TaxID=109871 RepID=F4NSQ3_BATDJ|nr:uncharacterized protein BATDEDRAFT_22160 [Batrachochytrium dendrobatidis JAM81]EGF84268.1 hypothetical protein BATDEDRAFT_22160 [Batrachochytrium dendrobatidis JAM81]|eukprot:XP_006675484.1 hypothetical protein BATDEDRAFT_22160 [Batrachochytrium dendrobatidis JAM81]